MALRMKMKYDKNGFYVGLFTKGATQMKRFDNVVDAMNEDGPGLFVYDLGRRGSLFDRDRERLQIALVRCGLGIQFIRVRFDGKPEQCVDVSGDVLKKLLAECGCEEPTAINMPDKVLGGRDTIKIENPGFKRIITDDTGGDDDNDDDN